MPAHRKPEWSKQDRRADRRRDDGTKVRCGFWTPVWCGPDGRGCTAMALELRILDEGREVPLCGYHLADLESVPAGLTRRWILGEGLTAGEQALRDQWLEGLPRHAG
jgi:hypothetical protein